MKLLLNFKKKISVCRIPSAVILVVLKSHASPWLIMFFFFLIFLFVLFYTDAHITRAPSKLTGFSRPTSIVSTFSTVSESAQMVKT